MSHVVVKPFKSVNRKFKAGDKITAADIDAGGAYSLDDWAARGFVRLEGAETASLSPSKDRDAKPDAA